MEFDNRKIMDKFTYELFLHIGSRKVGLYLATVKIKIGLPVFGLLTHEIW